jgi:hypothetical protein
VLDDALPPWRGPPWGVLGIAVQLAGDRLVGAVQPKEIATQDPDAQGLRMAGEDGPGPVVEPAGTGLAKRALSSRLGFVVALLNDPVGAAVRAADPVRPPQVAKDWEAAGIVDQSWKVEHPWGARILADSRNRRRSDRRILFNCTAISGRVQVTP